MMGSELASKMENCNHLTWLMAQKEFIKALAKDYGAGIE
jgi:hypothetical protein